MLLMLLKVNRRRWIFQTSWRNVSRSNIERKFRKVGEEKEEKRLIGWLLLMVPVTTFALGTWQIKRKLWKRDLVAKIEKNIAVEPVQLPADLSDLQDKEYRPFRVRGTFLHDREILLGPRQMISGRESSPKKFSPPPGSGYHVITPFKLSDRNLTILVNRGWVPTSSKSPETRLIGQIEGETELVGVLRLTENISSFGVKNAPGQGIWLYRDLDAMSGATGSSTIFLDADGNSTLPGGPLGGQTTVSLRDDHLTYVATWYGISAATLYMWFQKYGHYLRLK